MHGAGRPVFRPSGLTAAARTASPSGRRCLLPALLLLLNGVLQGTARRLQAAARILWARASFAASGWGYARRYSFLVIAGRYKLGRMAQRLQWPWAAAHPARVLRRAAAGRQHPALFAAASRL